MRLDNGCLMVSPNEGYRSLWDKIINKNLDTFKRASAITEIRMGDNVVKIKEERRLLIPQTRYSLTAKKRHYIL